MQHRSSSSFDQEKVSIFNQSPEMCIYPNGQKHVRKCFPKQDTAGDFNLKTTKTEKSKIGYQQEYMGSQGLWKGLFLLLFSFYHLQVRTNMVLETL